MSRRSLLCARVLFLSAFAFAVFVPAVVMAQPKCEITTKQIGKCQVELCGPAGFNYNWSTKGIPSLGTTQCITVNKSGTYFLEIFDPGKEKPVGKCSETVKVEKCFNNPPDCSQARAKDELVWPPNHKMVPVEIVGVTDPDGDPIFIEVFGVTQDEPLDTLGDGSTCADAEIVNGEASVRAERTGDPNIPGNGRVYVLTFEATDGQGGKCKGKITVCVPHDMGQGDSCIDDGQVYDSLGECP